MTVVRTEKFRNESDRRYLWLVMHGRSGEAWAWEGAVQAAVDKLLPNPHSRPLCLDPAVQGRGLREAYFGTDGANTHRLIFRDRRFDIVRSPHRPRVRAGRPDAAGPVSGASPLRSAGWGRLSGMNAAPPAADTPVLDLPPAFAKALAADGTLRVRDPNTGARFRLVADAPDRSARPEPHFDSGRTLAEEVDEAIAQLDAGLGMTTEQFRAEWDRRRAARV